VDQSLYRKVQETSLVSRPVLVAQAEINVDRTHNEESSAGEKQALTWNPHEREC
jgi:hypothetical protein